MGLLSKFDPDQAAPIAPASEDSEPVAKPADGGLLAKFDPMPDEQVVAPQTSGVGAFASHAALGAAPAYAGWVGAGAGAELGAGIGGLAGPIGAGVGGLAGGLAGLFGGAKLGETAQDYALDAAPDSWKEKIGLDERTRQLQEQQHPYASFMGGMAPYLLTMRPGGFSRSALPENSTALQRLMANPTIARAIGGVAMGGLELAQEGGLTGHEPDWTKVAIATGFGTIFNKPTRFGEALSGLGSQAMRGTVLRPPTLIEADENKIIGPGNTEAVFQGSQDKDPEAALTALKNAQAERLATGQPPLPPPDANQLVAQMHPELFNAYDDLVRRKKTFQEWEGAAQEGPEKNAAQMHLRTTQNELDELYPQVRAAYRRANDHLGRETVAAAPVPGGQPIIDNEHDVVSGAVANKNENIVYIDKRIPQSVPELLDKDGNEADLHKYLAIHEQAEKQAMAQGMGYDEAHHNVATPAEKAAVQADGVSWQKYSEVIDGFLSGIEKEKPTNAPPNPHVDPEAAVHDKAGAPESVPQAPTQPAQPNASEQHRTAIVNDVTQKLIAAKRPAEEAEAAARLIAAHYEARAGRFGGALGSAQDLYNTEAPEIKAGKGAKKKAKEYAQEMLGKIRMEEGKRSVITLMKGANASTFIHETGHAWLEELMKDAQHPSAPQSVIEDANIARRWLGLDEIEAYHGSPHDFTAFDSSKIGTGEGAQAYGHGLYFAGNEGVAKQYRDALSHPALQSTPEGMAHSVLQSEGIQGDVGAAIGELKARINSLNQADPKYVAPGTKERFQSAIDYLQAYGAPDFSGHMYRVQINANPDHFLDWDKPLSEQHPVVQQKLKDAGLANTNATGADIYDQARFSTPPDADLMQAVDAFVKNGPEPKEVATQRLQQAGIPGIKYLDAGSRGNLSPFHVRQEGNQFYAASDALNHESPPFGSRDEAKDWIKANTPQGTSNYVVFNDKDIEITHHNDVPVADIKSRDHEKFAKAFEQYMREGVAPSPGLAGVFAKFRNWLLNIYETIKGLGKPISEDIRGVFDRMLSTAPERTVIAPERGGGPSLADIHKADADLTDPADADKIADRMAAERARYINEPPPEIEHEVAATATVTGDVPATEAGEGGSGRQDLGGEGSTARPLAPGSSVGEGRGEDGASGGGASAKGAGSSSRASTGSESNRARPDAGGQPLAPAPKPALGSSESRILDKAGNIRVENLTNSQDVAQAIHDSADRNADFIGVRGTMTKGQMSDLADAMGLSATNLDEAQLARALGGAENLAPRILAARRLVVQSAALVSDAAKAAARGTDADAAALGVAIARHDMIQSALAGVTAEWGRAGNAFHSLMSGWEKAQDLNQFLKENTGRDLFQLKLMAKYFSQIEEEGRISSGVRDSAQRRYGKMIIEYIVNNFISGIPSHITYVAANGITLAEKVLLTPLVGHVLTGGKVVHASEVGAGLHAIKEAFPSAVLATKQAFLEGQRPLLPGEKFTPGKDFQGNNRVEPGRVNMKAAYADLLPGDLLSAVYGTIRGLKDWMISVGKLADASAPLLGTQYSPRGEIPDFAIKGVPALPIGTLARAPGRMVAAMHTFMNVLNYAVETNQDTLRQAMNEGHEGQALINRVGELRNNPSEDKMAAYAATANNLSLMGQNGKLLQKLSLLVNHEFNSGPFGPTPWLRLIDPFVQIGGQINRQGPGRFGFLAPEIRADLMGKNGTEAQAIAQSRAITGGAIALTFAALAAEGYATGSGPSEPKQMAAWRRLGNQPYSLRVGDIWYPLHKLGGLGLIAGMSAQLHDIAKVASDGELAQAVNMVRRAVTQNYLDESFMRGPADLIKALDDHDRSGERYVSNWLSNMLPYSVGQAAFARMIDPYVRHAGGYWEAMQAKIPFVSEGLHPMRDVWGEPIKNLPGFGYHLTSIYESHVNNDPTEKALYDLGVYPGPVSSHIRNVKLTEQEYDDYARIAGKIAKDRMDAIVNSQYWQVWPSNVRHDYLQSNLKLAREAGANLVMMKYPHIPIDADRASHRTKPQ